MPTTPDPVTEGAAYRELLFGLLGDDDPAQVQEATPAAVRDAIARAGRTLATPPAEDEWSVLELVGHITDAELVAAARYRWILAHEAPELAGYDQDLWVGRLRHREADPQELVSLFEPLRGANVELWRRTPVQERSRYGIHAERGRESFEDLFRMLAGHDRFHLAQIDRTLATVLPRDAPRSLERDHSAPHT